MGCGPQEEFYGKKIESKIDKNFKILLNFFTKKKGCSDISIRSAVGKREWSINASENIVLPENYPIVVKKEEHYVETESSRSVESESDQADSADLAEVPKSLLRRLGNELKRLREYEREMKTEMERRSDASSSSFAISNDFEEMMERKRASYNSNNGDNDQSIVYPDQPKPPSQDFHHDKRFQMNNEEETMSVRDQLDQTIVYPDQPRPSQEFRPTHQKKRSFVDMREFLTIKK
jgi:hypothetical protein